MTLRRFQNLQLGALNAQRMNEIVDAISRLQAKVDGRTGDMEAVRDRILVRVTGQGVAAGFDGCTKAIRCVSYPFTEIFLRISGSGNVADGTCVGYDIPDGAISSTRGAFLLAFEDAPSLAVGSAMIAHLAPFSVAGNADDKQMVYVPSMPFGGGGELRICTLSEALPDGRYAGTLNAEGENGEQVEIENLYETQNYYGAAQVTLECADIVTGLRLPIGSDVWAMKVGGRGARAGEWVTMTPTPFGVECTCGDLGQPVALMTGNADADAVAAGIISRIMGGT